MREHSPQSPLPALIHRALSAGIRIERNRSGVAFVLSGPVDPELLAELRERRVELAAELSAHHREPPAEVVRLLEPRTPRAAAHDIARSPNGAPLDDPNR